MRKKKESKIPIGKWMVKQVMLVQASTTVLDAAITMKSNRIGSLLIGDYKNVRGIFTDWDLVRSVATGIDPSTEVIGNWMSKNINCLDASLTHREGIALMVNKHIRHAPVLENGKLVGIISARDLLRFEYTLLEETFQETQKLLGTTQDLLEKDSDERYIDLLKLNEKLEAQAFTDGLTGLYNHRYFQERLGEEIARSSRHNYPVCLIFIDVDHFKNYNDQNGHMLGDYVLRTIGDVLTFVSEDVINITARLRKTDIVARYGGEEFVIIIPYANNKDGKALAERIRKTIEDHNFDFQEKQPNKNLTVSLGVCSFPDLASNKEELIKFADQALYEAKDKGRNKVCVYKKP